MQFTKAQTIDDFLLHDTQNVSLSQVGAVFFSPETSDQYLLETKDLTTCIALILKGSSILKNETKDFVALYHWSGLNDIPMDLKKDIEINKIIKNFLCEGSFEKWYEEHKGIHHEKDVLDSVLKMILSEDTKRIFENEFKTFIAQRCLIYFIREVKNQFNINQLNIQEIAFVGGQKRQEDEAGELLLSGTEFEIDALDNVLKNESLKKEIQEKTGVILPKTYHAMPYLSAGEQHVNVYVGLNPNGLDIRYAVFEQDEDLTDVYSEREDVEENNNDPDEPKRTRSWGMLFFEEENTFKKIKSSLLPKDSKEHDICEKKTRSNKF